VIVVDEYLAIRSLTGLLPDEPLAVTTSAHSLAAPLANARVGDGSAVASVAGVVAS